MSERRIHFAPFGKHTTFMLASYVRHVVIVTAVLLAIALTIDLWPQFQMVAAASGSGSLDAVWGVLRFTALRTPGLVAPFLPFATFLGVVWTEVAHTRSGDRMLVWNSGRSPLHCLAPALLLGAILGAADFTMDGYLGPASMGVQMTERLGLDGQRLDRSRTYHDNWISISGDLIRTDITFGPPPVLRNLLVFKRSADGHITAMYQAESARRDPANGLWVLQNGESWTARNSSVKFSRAEDVVPFERLAVPLHLEPQWLEVFGMETQYIPIPTLKTLRRIDHKPDFKGAYRTRLNVIYGELLLPGAMALLAASLSMMFMAYTTSTPAIVGIVFVGYIAHFGTKACLLLGQNAYMAPMYAGWLVPVLLLTTTTVVLIISERKRRRVSAV